MTVQWIPREPPLEVAAVLATGVDASTLARAAAERLRGGARLRAGHDADTLLVLGPVDVLPWVPRARWLGWDGGALLPTTRRPSAPADLVRRAVLQLRGAPDVELLVVLAESAVLTTRRPEADADPAYLEAWAARR